MSNEKQIPFFDKIYFFIIGFTLQLMLCIMFIFRKKYTITNVKILEFIARKSNLQLNYSRKQKFFTGTQAMHQDFFVRYLIRKNLKPRKKDLNEDYYRLFLYYSHVLDTYNINFLTHKHIMNRNVLVEKIKTLNL